MSDAILIWIVSLAPSLTAVITAIVALVAWMKKFHDLRKDIKERVEMDELKEKLEITLSECRELEKVLKKDIEEHTKIKK